MHGFDGVDVSFLLGAELAQVRVGKYQLQLVFDTATVAVESGLEMCERGTTTSIEDFPAQCDLVCRLLGKPIIGWSTPGPKVLQLCFEDDALLRIIDSDQDESCQIQHGDALIVI